MTDSRAPFADRIPPVRRSSTAVSLASLTVDLAQVARFPAALLRRRSVLPFAYTDEALQVVVPPRLPQAAADELAFAAGCPVMLWEPAEGNLPKLIEQATRALARGERQLRPQDAEAGALAGSLVYVEDLGGLAAGSGVAASEAGEPSLVADGIHLGPGFSFDAPAPPASPAPALAASGHPPPVAPPAAPGLPPVVDLEPDWGPDRGAAARRSAPPAPPAPPAEEEELFDDPDDPGLVDVLYTDVEPTPPEEVGLTALVAQGGTAEDDRLRAALRALGLQVTAAGRGAEALAMAEPSGAAVLAWAMGPAGDDPFEGVRRLRRAGHRASRELVVVLVVPPELAGWRVRRDLQTTYGVDVTLDPGWETSLLRHRLEQALQERTGEAVMLGDPAQRESAATLYRQAVERYQSGLVEEAVPLFEAALLADPWLAGALVGLAVARVKQQRPEQAILAFERAVTADPSLVTALRSLATLYEKRGFRHKAVETWERTWHASSDEGQRQEILARIRALMEHRS